MWKKGISPTSVSSSSSGIEFHACSMFATRLRWVSITPFIRPVVPLEYGRTARSSGSTSTSSDVAPGRALPTKPSASSIRSLAPELATCRSISSPVSSAYIGVTTPPARRIAW